MSTAFYVLLFNFTGGHGSMYLSPSSKKSCGPTRFLYRGRPSLVQVQLNFLLILSREIEPPSNIWLTILKMKNCNIFSDGGEVSIDWADDERTKNLPSDAPILAILHTITGAPILK